jgi:hypothetical protein
MFFAALFTIAKIGQVQKSIKKENPAGIRARKICAKMSIITCVTFVHGAMLEISLYSYP